MKDKLTMVMILDGFGENSNKDGNAVELANTCLLYTSPSPRDTR